LDEKSPWFWVSLKDSILTVPSCSCFLPFLSSIPVSHPPHFFSCRPYFRRRTGADFEGFFVASLVGVVSGVYIFKPLLDEMAVNRAERERREALEAVAADGGVVPANDKVN
jgi:hypothetical protein